MGEQSDDKYSLHLTGGGIVIEKVVDKATARVIANLVLGGEAANAGLGAPSPEGSLIRKTELSLREFLNDVAPSTNKERITAIAQYLYEAKGKESFSTEDIKSSFRAAREQLPKNLSRDLTTALAYGWIDEAGDKGRYHVTSTGAKAVQNRFGRQTA